MDADEWGGLPLFPLDTVLFPGMVLPLHIFEERYKLMVNRCLEEERPFGVLLSHEGKDVAGTGGRATPYEVGTTAVIAGVSRMEDGRMNLVTIGSERFRLLSVRNDGAYLVGTAQPWPLDSGSELEAQGQVEPVRTLFRQYLSMLDKAQGHKISIKEVPDDPQALAVLVAIALQVPKPEKQRLLEQATIAGMLAAEQVIIKREQLLLDLIIRTQQEQWEGGFSGFLAKN
jgi:Lon protease-like protein